MLTTIRSIVPPSVAPTAKLRLRRHHPPTCHIAGSARRTIAGTATQPARKIAAQMTNTPSRLRSAADPLRTRATTTPRQIVASLNRAALTRPAATANERSESWRIARATISGQSRPQLVVTSPTSATSAAAAVALMTSRSPPATIVPWT